MKDDYVAIVTSTYNKTFKDFGFKYFMAYTGKYENNETEDRMISIKVRGRRMSWIATDEAILTYCDGKPLYLLDESNVIPYHKVKTGTVWNPETINAFIERNFGHETVKAMGRPMKFNINLKVVLMVIAFAVIAFFVFKAVM